MGSGWQLSGALPCVGSETRQPRLAKLVYLTIARAQSMGGTRRGNKPLVTDTPP
jgi:hypothetical protein